MAHARRRHRDGATVATIAAELGLSTETIRRWTAGSPGADPARLVPVEVVVAATAAPRQVSVVSPSGFRVDGITLAEAAELLRALR